MFDRYNRKITYLRISVTDRCNLRCTYCMPAEGVKLLKHEEILTFDEIVDFTKVAVSLGISKVRITGGEPLVRKGIVELVQMLSEIEEINDLSMTTNGILLKQFAKPLFDAGIKRINVSLDTLCKEKFSQITRGGNIDDVLSGIAEAKAVGFNPIKINCVINKTSNEHDAVAVKKFAADNNLQIRFIPLMDLDNGTHGIVEGGEGGNCAKCNRIRLTANGIVKPCLFSEIGFNVRELGPEQAILSAVDSKPRSGNINTTGEFYNIGG